MPRTNETLAKLEKGEPTYGAWVSSMSPRAAEVFGANGFDWAVIDMEHTPIGADGVENVIRGIERHDLTPIVRLPELDYGIRGTCKRVLDSGAQGIIVPRVETAEQAQRIADAALYPPEGSRGVVGSSRANLFGTDFDRYVDEANDELFVAVQLETATGADRADDILSVEGINGVMVGENDLSATHGAPGQKDESAVQADVDAILEAADAYGVHAGIVAPTPERIEQRSEEGFNFLSLGSDLYFVSRSIGQLLPEE